MHKGWCLNLYTSTLLIVHLCFFTFLIVSEANVKESMLLSDFIKQQSTRSVSK